MGTNVGGMSEWKGDRKEERKDNNKRVSVELVVSIHFVESQAAARNQPTQQINDA